MPILLFTCDLRRVKAEVYQAKEAAGNLQAKTEEERWITAAGGIFEDEPMQMGYGASVNQHYVSEQSNMVYKYGPRPSPDPPVSTPGERVPDHPSEGIIF